MREDPAASSTTSFGRKLSPPETDGLRGVIGGLPRNCSSSPGSPWELSIGLEAIAELTGGFSAAVAGTMADGKGAAGGFAAAAAIAGAAPGETGIGSEAGDAEAEDTITADEGDGDLAASVAGDAARASADGLSGTPGSVEDAGDGTVAMVAAPAGDVGAEALVEDGFVGGASDATFDAGAALALKWGEPSAGGFVPGSSGWVNGLPIAFTRTA
jgi:hypothetical protein